MKKLIFVLLAVVSTSATAFILDNHPHNVSKPGVQNSGIAVLNQNLMGKTLLEVETLGLPSLQTYRLSLSQQGCAEAKSGNQESQVHLAQSNELGILNTSFDVNSIAPQSVIVSRDNATENSICLTVI